MDLDGLRRALDQLAGMTGVARVREARRLSDEAMAALAAAGDEGVWQETRRRSRADVASELGVSLAAVGKAVSRYRRTQA